MKRKTVIALLATMALTTGAAGTVLAANFTDVTKGSQVDAYVTDVTNKNLMEGKNDTEFGVAEDTTRSDLVQALYQMNINLPVTGSHEFTDIDGREDAAAIEWADDVGLFDELKSDFFTDNKFEPDKALTREEAAQIIYSFAQKVDKLNMNNGVGTLEGYTDSDAEVTYVDAMKWALGNKILTGDDLNTDETENAIRATTAISKAETAQALSVYMDLRTPTTETKAQSTNPDEGEVTNPDEGEVTNPDEGEVTNPDEGEVTDPDEGGDVTDPDEGGDVTDPDEGEVTDPDEGGDVTDPDEHTHTWGDPSYVVDQEGSKVWVIDKEAEYEQNWVVDKPAVYEQNWVVDKEAEYDEVKVVDKEAWTEDITAIHTVCYNCGLDYTAEGYTPQQLAEHVKQHMLNGESGQYGSREVVVDTIEHPEEFHMETVLVSPEEGHFENGALISPEEGHYEDGDLISPEEGHWETTPELGHWVHTCTDCGTTENCPKPEDA